MIDPNRISNFDEQYAEVIDGKAGAFETFGDDAKLMQRQDRLATTDTRVFSIPEQTPPVQEQLPHQHVRPPFKGILGILRKK